LIAAYRENERHALVIVHANRVLQTLRYLSPEERESQFNGAYRVMAMAIFAQASDSAGRVVARRRMDSLATRVLAMVGASVPGRASTRSEAARPEQMMEYVRSAKDEVDHVNTMLALIGQAAPPVLGHAWLNTSDSAYRTPPITHSFGDGVVRVVAFGEIQRTHHMISVLDNVQQWFPHRVEAVFVTHTVGHAGPDLVSPADETVWMAAYVKGVRHLTLPIAIWAGDKQKVPALVEAEFGVVPVNSPNELTAYRDRGDPFVVIDGHGIIRATLDVQNRRQEEQLRRRLAAMLASATPTPPASLVHQ